MQEICRAADREVVEAVKTKAEIGPAPQLGGRQVRILRQGRHPDVQGTEHLRAHPGDERAGENARPHARGPRAGQGRRVHGQAGRDGRSPCPAATSSPPNSAFIADKLRTHNVKVEVLAKPVKASGEEFVIDKIVRAGAAAAPRSSSKAGSPPRRPRNSRPGRSGSTWPSRWPTGLLPASSRRRRTASSARASSTPGSRPSAPTSGASSTRSTSTSRSRNKPV